MRVCSGISNFHRAKNKHKYIKCNSDSAEKCLRPSSQLTEIKTNGRQVLTCPLRLLLGIITYWEQNSFATVIVKSAADGLSPDVSVISNGVLINSSKTETTLVPKYTHVKRPFVAITHQTLLFRLHKGLSTLRKLGPH